MLHANAFEADVMDVEQADTSGVADEHILLGDEHVV